MREGALEELGVTLHADTIRDRHRILPKVMTPEDRILFTCTRREFTDAHRRTVLDICYQEEVDWDILCWTARVHGVAPLVYFNLQRCPNRKLGIPEKIEWTFKHLFAENIVAKHQQAKVITGALKYFNSRSIEIMLIKGAALDILVYASHLYTVSRDIDLILRRRREEFCDEEIKEFTSTFQGIPLEFDFFGHHDLDLNGVLSIDFQGIWDDAIEIQFRGQSVFVMTPEDLLIAACTNSCRKRYFNLKTLCDIARIISAYPEMNWEELIRKAKSYHCENIVYTGLLVTQMTLGCELPDELLDRFVESSLRAAIIQYLSQRMSFSSLAPLYSGERFLDRRVNLSLLLPYASYRWDQVWRKVGFVWHTKDGSNL